MSLIFRERKEQKQDLNDRLKGQQSTSNFYLNECVCVCVCVCVCRASGQDKKCLQYLVVGFCFILEGVVLLLDGGGGIGRSEVDRLGVRELGGEFGELTGRL